MFVHVNLRCCSVLFCVCPRECALYYAVPDVSIDLFQSMLASCLDFHFQISRGAVRLKKMNTKSKAMTRLEAVVETIPDHRWAAIGKCLLASDLLDKRTFEQQWGSDSRNTLFINVLNSVGNPSRPSWKQLVKVLQVELGYDHELITLVKEVNQDCGDRVRNQSHGYGTTLQFKGGKEFDPDSGDETDNPSTPLLSNYQGSVKLVMPVVVIVQFSIANGQFVSCSGDASLPNKFTLCDSSM